MERVLRAATAMGILIKRVLNTIRSMIPTNGNGVSFNPLKVLPEIDRELVLERRVDGGNYSTVFLVRRGATRYALKVNYFHEAYQIDAGFTLENEAKVLEALVGVPGIPQPEKLYTDVPSLTNPRRGKNALLRAFIEGTTLRAAGKQPFRYFLGMEDTIDHMNERGYGIPTVDFNGDNVLVGVRGDAWLIDLMCAPKLDPNPKLAREQIALGKRKFRDLRQKYED